MEVSLRNFKGLPDVARPDRGQVRQRAADRALCQPGPDRNRRRAAVGLEAGVFDPRIADAGVFYPITPSTEGGELYQQSYAQGELNVFGHPKVAIEAEGEHAAQGGATAYSVTGRRTVNFTSGGSQSVAVTATLGGCSVTVTKSVPVP